MREKRRRREVNVKGVGNEDGYGRRREGKKRVSGSRQEKGRNERRSLKTNLRRLSSRARLSGRNHLLPV